MLPSLSDVKTSANKQPRKGVPPSLIPELKEVVYLDSKPQTDEYKILREVNGEKAQDDEHLEENDKKIVAGVFRTPHEFVKEALSLKHPFDMESKIPHVTRDALITILSTSPQQLTADRAKTIANLIRWRTELS